MGKVVMYSSVSVDGFVADENDQPGPLFDWLSSGDVPLDEGGEMKVSQMSYDYIRPYWDQIGVTIVGRHVFDITDGWDGKPPSGIDHVVVVTDRPDPEVVGEALSTLGKGVGPALMTRAREVGVKLPAELADPSAELTPALVLPFLRAIAGHFFPLLAEDAQDQD